MQHLVMSVYNFCRSHFYKILLGYPLIILLAIYAISAIRSSDFRKQLPGNSSFSSAANSLLSWSSFNNWVTYVDPADITAKLESVDNLSTPLTTTETTSTVQNVKVELPLCPLIPPKLVGALKVLMDTPSFHELENIFKDLDPGGRFYPRECTSRYRVAIVIPYRNREEHLRIFLHNLHFMLMRQQLDYGIYVVEQYGDTKFNRAMLMNIGYVEALKQHDYQCFIFHDVDLIPEDDRNIYSCPEQPRHMSVAIDLMNYRLLYQDLFGGVSALTREQMEKVNGFSNLYWGWGGEDDDMSARVRSSGYSISRYPANVARYKMLKHTKDEPNPDRYKMLYNSNQRIKTDGLINLKYKLHDLLLKKLYTWLLVEIAP